MDCKSVVFLGVLGIVGGFPIWHPGYGGYDALKNEGYSIHPVSLSLAEEVFHPEYDEGEKRRKAFEREHEILKVKIGANHPELIPHLERDAQLAPHDVLYKPQAYDLAPHDGLYKPQVYDIAPHDGLYKPMVYDIDPHEGLYKPNVYDIAPNDGLYKPQVYGFNPHYELPKPQVYNNGLFTKQNQGQYGYHMHGAYQNEINYIPYK